MNTPLTPEMSTLQCVLENSLDAYDSCLSQTELGIFYNDAIFGIGTFSFDHENNGLSNSSPVKNFGVQESSWLDQSFSHNQSDVPPSSTSALNFVDDNQSINVLASSSLSQQSCGFGQVQLPEHQTLNDSVSFGEIFNLHHPDGSATDCIGFQTIPTFLPQHSLQNENNFYSQHPNTFPDYDPLASQPQNSAQSQNTCQYDIYSNAISPQCIWNEQYTPPLSGSVTATEAAADPASDPASLVPATLGLDSETHISRASYESLPRQLEQSQAMPEVRLTAANPNDLPVKVKRRRRRKPPPPPEVAAAKRKAFLQRNRDAASKSRIKKKHQIDNMEDEERMERQLNVVLKEEFKEIRGEVLSLREKVKDIPCAEDCEGCGGHVPMRKGSLAATSNLSVWSESEQVDEEEVRAIDNLNFFNEHENDDKELIGYYSR